MHGAFDFVVRAASAADHSAQDDRVLDPTLARKMRSLRWATREIVILSE